MTIALQSRLMTGGLQPARGGAASGGGIVATLEDMLEQLDAEDEQAEREALERGCGEAAERLDDPDPFAEAYGRPMGEIVGEIGRDLERASPPSSSPTPSSRASGAAAPTRDPGGPCAGDSWVPARRFTPAGMTGISAGDHPPAPASPAGSPARPPPPPAGPGGSG